MNKKSTVVAATGTDAAITSVPGSGDTSPVHGAPEILDVSNTSHSPSEQRGASASDTGPHRRTQRERLGYFMTKDFWTVLLLGQILALCLTGTNTLTTLLVIEGTSIPAFQTFFNYVLLNLIYTSFTVYKYGLKGWARLIWKDGWKCKFLFYGFSAHLLPPVL
jgi:solute carrier family 35, member F1/2